MTSAQTVLAMVTISGPARSKKTSNVLARVKGRYIVLPSAAWRAWLREARVTVDGVPLVSVRKSVPRLVAEGPPGSERLWAPLTGPMNCRALFYLTARQHGDLLGYMQGLADLLEARQVIANDRLLASWDGSRLLKDSVHPRVAVTLGSR